MCPTLSQRWCWEEIIPLVNNPVTVERLEIGFSEHLVKGQIEEIQSDLERSAFPSETERFSPNAFSQVCRRLLPLSFRYVTTTIQWYGNSFIYVKSSSMRYLHAPQSTTSKFKKLIGYRKNGIKSTNTKTYLRVDVLKVARAAREVS
jgi:hypothetical protein